MQTAKQGKALPEEELSQAKATIENLRKTFSHAILADLQHDFTFGRANGYPASDTFDHLDQLVDEFLKRPHQEITLTLVEEYITADNDHIAFQIKGNPIMKLSYNQETNCDTVTLSEGVSPDDHLPFIILNSTDLPYDCAINIALSFLMVVQ